MTATRPRGTRTSRFGVGRRESHDASGFYERFRSPVLSPDDQLFGHLELPEGDRLRVGDARSMDLPDQCVALVVTSPPYFAGKEYETALGEGHIPATYVAYLEMLQHVFAECHRVLEPGGRIAVNVANLGRKPYRSLSADVTAILQDQLGFLLRGEVIWQKARGASGSCAWGSFCSAANPVLRDLTERVIIASKGRFDRARSRAQRQEEGLPHRNTISKDEFMEATLDVWEMRPESARRVGHPAPFPVALPLRLIQLYTYENDLVLDPFLGSGTTAAAARQAGRRYVGYDTDAGYVEAARERVGQVTVGQPHPAAETCSGLAARLLEEAGFADVQDKVKIPRMGLTVDLVATDRAGERWYFPLVGAFTSSRSVDGLCSMDALWKTVGQLSVMAPAVDGPVVVMTTGLPRRRSAGGRALRALGPDVLFDAFEVADANALERLATYARGGCTRPSGGFWEG